ASKNSSSRIQGNCTCAAIQFKTSDTSLSLKQLGTNLGYGLSARVCSTYNFSSVAPNTSPASDSSKAIRSDLARGRLSAHAAGNGRIVGRHFHAERRDRRCFDISASVERIFAVASL